MDGDTKTARTDAPKFPFPFEPYDIQQGLMSAMYACLENRQVGIMESPTGTGKTQSLINSALEWVRVHREREENGEDDVEPGEQEQATATPGLPAWVVQESRKREREERKAAVTERRRKQARREKRVILTAGLASNVLDDPDESRTVLIQDSDTSDEDTDYVAPKIIYTSRTHTQLKQFIDEVKKTVWWKNSDFRCVQLGARQHLCINDEVQRKANGSGERLNDLCMTLGGDGGGSTCPYVDKGALSRLTDRAHARPMDIEDLIKEGRREKACPYYVTKRAVAFSSVVAVPYAGLLSDAARKGFGLDLTDNVVIVDEAHNIIDAVNGAHSVVVSLHTLTTTVKSLSSYLAKYLNKLHVKNKIKLRQLIAVLKKIAAWLEQNGKQGNVRVVPAGDFCFATGIEGVNVLDIVRFTGESKLFRKLQGFVAEMEIRANEQLAKEKLAKGDPKTSFKKVDKVSVAQMYAVEAFVMKALTADTTHHRLLLSPDDANPTLHLASIFAGDIFRPLVSSARSLILAGGTMSPVTDMLQELLPSVPPSSIQLYQCGHVIPKTSILPIIVGNSYDFRFSNRSNANLLNHFGNTLKKVASSVKGGVVAFFPSYGYENEVVKHLEAVGLLNEVRKIKKIFREPQRGQGDVMEMLASYQQCIDSEGGAVLLCVVGGKLSEGINFSDDYGRCIIMVGLPYPNHTDPLLKEKQAVLKDPANFLDIMCMKAVNQSIGRAIRHRGDYAAMLLLDNRYAQEKITNLLPKWIAASLVQEPTIDSALDSMSSFYKRLQQPSLVT